MKSLKDLREKFRRDVELDEAALSELRNTLKEWQEVWSCDPNGLMLI